MAFESPLNDPYGTKTYVLLIVDYISTSIFTIEVVLKIFAYGLFYNGDDSYFKNSWNIIDFLIVVISIVSLCPLEVDLSVLKVIRMIRLLRPLRVISKVENLKLSINALIISIPAISQLLLIVLLIMFIFGIVGVNLLKGKSFYCETAQIA